MPRAFLFDIGNVLLTFDFMRALRLAVVKSAVEDVTEMHTLLEPLKLAYENGQIDRGTFFRSAADAIGYRGTEATFVAAWEDIFELNEPMAALVETLHGRYPLYLLSNTSDIHREYIFARYPIFSRFNAGVYSYEARASKPGRQIYEIAIRELALEPAATFFIDDLLPNIETARSLHFRAHHYRSDRHDLLLTELQAAGVDTGAASPPPLSP